jgi:hypothetical protein
MRLRLRMFERPSRAFCERSRRRVLAYASCLSAVLLAAFAAAGQPQMPTPAADSVAPASSLPPVQALPDTLTQLSVVTFGRGAQIHQYFGHNAFLVSGPGLASPLVVNYGMFSFGPDMLPQFLRGRLRFWVGTTELDATTAMYAAEKRDVRVRDLRLEPAALQVVLEQLKHDLRPENRSYLYDHYSDNCSTRLRDALDRALGGQLRRAWAQPSKYTLRAETLRYTQHDPLVAWSMMFGLSDRVDRPLHVWDEAFLPEELERLLDTTSYQDSHGARVTLVSGRRTLFDAHTAPVPEQPAKSWPLLLMLGTFIAIVALALADRVQPGQKLNFYRICYAALTAAVGIGAGLFGLLLLGLWAFSDHAVTYGNENLLLANPLSLISGILSLALMVTGRVAGWLRSLWGALAFSSLLLLVAHVASTAFNQDIYWSAALLVPINIGFALASQRVW